VRPQSDGGDRKNIRNPFLVQWTPLERPHARLSVILLQHGAPGCAIGAELSPHTLFDVPGLLVLRGTCWNGRVMNGAPALNLENTMYSMYTPTLHFNSCTRCTPTLCTHLFRSARSEVRRSHLASSSTYRCSTTVAWTMGYTQCWRTVPVSLQQIIPELSLISINPVSGR
jgi:hypothetical protein